MDFLCAEKTMAMHIDSNKAWYVWFLEVHRSNGALMSFLISNHDFRPDANLFS